MSFCPFVFKGIKVQKLFSKTAFYSTSKLKKKSFIFKTEFYCNIKMKKFLFTTSVSLLHFQSAACLCGWKWMGENIDLREWGKKIIFWPRVGRAVRKNFDRGVENAARGRNPKAAFLNPVFNTSSNNSSDNSLLFKHRCFIRISATEKIHIFTMF